jgi:hypothetical protein
LILLSPALRKSNFYQRRYITSSLFFPNFLFYMMFFRFSILQEIYLKSGVLDHIMTRCLFCGSYCEVKCGIYCEGYQESPGKKE